MTLEEHKRIIAGLPGDAPFQAALDAALCFSFMAEEHRAEVEALVGQAGCL